MHQSSQCEFQRESKFGMEDALWLSIEIQKTHCGGRNIENLIESTCFYLNISQVHVFCLDFSKVRMFCGDDRSKLVPRSEKSTGFPS